MKTPTNIPTPRTDAAKITNLDAYESHSVVVPLYKMAELERENVVLRQALENIYNLLGKLCPNDFKDEKVGEQYAAKSHDIAYQALTPPTTI